MSPEVVIPFAVGAIALLAIFFAVIKEAPNMKTPEAAAAISAAASALGESAAAINAAAAALASATDLSALDQPVADLNAGVAAVAHAAKTIAALVPQ
jgi:hypothetical protein